jgi:hypothetical protein
MANSGMFVVGQSGNPGGRPKGSKRTPAHTLKRWIKHNGSFKELQNNYEHMKPGKERWEMWYKAHQLVYPMPQADSLTTSDIDALYDKLEQSLKHEAQQQKAG